MANRYADARNGNDSNDGLSWATAKKTLGSSVTAASTGDTIYCVGVFHEAVFYPWNTKGSITFQAVGFAILDGQLDLPTGVTLTGVGAGTLKFVGFTFRNFYSIGFYLVGNGGGVTLENCIVEGIPYGMYMPASSGPIVPLTLTNTIMRGCRLWAVYVEGSGCQITYRVSQCTFVNCGNGIRHWPATGTSVAVLRSIFHNIPGYMIYAVTAGYWAGPFDFNCYDFTGSNTLYFGGAYTSLSAWKAAIAIYDQNSISVDPLFLDEAKNLHRLKNTSPAVIDARILGAYNLLLADGCSDNFNATVWDTPDSVSPVGSVIQNSNGDWVLADGYDVGAITFKIDFGGLFNIRKLNLSHTFGGLMVGTGGGPTSVLDYDKTIPLGYETWEYRIATSVDGIAFGAFTAKNINEDLNLTGIWAIKVEATLRRDM
jgi:hypothetical protein